MKTVTEMVALSYVSFIAVMLWLMWQSERYLVTEAAFGGFAILMVLATILFNIFFWLMLTE